MYRPLTSSHGGAGALEKDVNQLKPGKPCHEPRLPKSPRLKVRHISLSTQAYIVTCVIDRHFPVNLSTAKMTRT